MLTICGQADNLAIDLTVKVNSNQVVIALIISLDHELLKCAILEEYTNAKRIIISRFMSKYANYFLLDRVGKGLVQVYIGIIFANGLTSMLLKLVMADPFALVSIVVREDVAMSYQHEALVVDKLLERLE